MRNVLKCARLELITFKPYLRSMMLVPALGIVMALALSSSMVLGFYLLFGVMMTASYPFGVTESNRLDFLRASLPMSKKDEVLGRYAFILLFGAAALAAGIVLVSLVEALRHGGSSVLETAAVLIAAFAVMLLLVALQYPLLYRFGYAKAKNFTAAPMVLLLIICIQLPKVLKPFGVTGGLGALLQVGGGVRTALLLAFCVVILGVYAASAALSVRLRVKYTDV